MAKSGKCKKASNRKDHNVAVVTTLQNKIRKLKKRLRDNPNQPVIRNALMQAHYDLNKHWGLK